MMLIAGPDCGSIKFANVHFLKSFPFFVAEKNASKSISTVSGNTAETGREVL